MRKPKYQKSIFSQFLHTLFVVCAVCLVVAAVLTAVIDPFYHYHKPLRALGLVGVQTKKEYQVPGVLRHFDYDAVLAGSSVVENNDNSWFDEAYGVTTVKAVRSYGGVADLCWYLDLAYSSHNEIRMVFFNLDPAALVAAPETTFASSGAPTYLYDNNPLNDIQYLLNKTVLLEEIPYMIAQSASGYNENLSYNWAEGKDFSQAGALSQYVRVRDEDVQAMKPAGTYQDNIQGNVNLLIRLVSSHPQTQFTFFLPPYSALWWDGAIRTGERDAYLNAEQQVLSSLLLYSNVRIYDFQNVTDIITNLDNYMDAIHFRPEVNKWMVDAMAAGQYEVTMETYHTALDNTRLLSEQMEETLIASLEAQGAFRYE